MMNKAELFRKVGGILSELNDQYEYIAANPESLNELELELFSANADFLSEHTKILLKLAMAKPTKPDAGYSQADARILVADKPGFSGPSPSFHSNLTEAEREEETAIPSPVVSDSALNRRPYEAPAESVSSLPEITEHTLNERVSPPAFTELRNESHNAPAPVELVKEPIIPEVVVPVRQEPVAAVPEPVKLPEAVTSPQPQPQPVPEAVVPAAPRVQTLNEIISGKRSAESSVAEKFNVQPIADLKSGVSLNDKLLFIKELFNGYSLAYSEAIEILNRFDSFEAAEAFLKTNYAGKNNWESKHSTAEKFYDILRRRFS